MRKTLVLALAASLLLSASCGRKDALEVQPVKLSCSEPAFLSPGDKIALISPAYSTSMENVQGAAEVIRSWGFEPVVGPNVGKEYLGKYAGTTEERLSDINWALEDPSIKAIICNRGGYGTIRFVESLPLEELSAHPKWLVGFSDITTLHGLETRAGVMSIHGTMGSFLAKSEGKDISSVLVKDILTGTIPEYSLPSHPQNRPGKATGTLVGGNLCTFSPVLGTDADATKGKDIILFIEEVGEDMSHIDRLLNILLLNGVMDRCNGIILGDFTECDANLDFGSVEQLVCSYLKDYDIPVCCGFPGGHGETNLPLVMGAPVSMEVGQDGSRISFLIEGEKETIEAVPSEEDAYNPEISDMAGGKQYRLVRAFNFVKYYSGLKSQRNSNKKSAQYKKGWPSRTGQTSIRDNFAEPPGGYGNVPFYWWSGDVLEMDRMTEQLKILSDASTDGLCVSYIHSHAEVDTALNAAGYGQYGLVMGGSPRVLSPEWRKVWSEFSERCADYGIGLGMDDYVVGWPGNGEIVDDVRSSLEGFQGRLEKKHFGKGETLPENILSQKPSAGGFDVIYTVPSPELHPDYGSLMVQNYFQSFEDSMNEHGRDGMNYFFQDELSYGLNIRSWCEGMEKIFKERKGYDIVPFLDALFITEDKDVDAQAAKVRMDYAEVLTCLAEERYFKPIFDWNAERGLIYGCDNEGRGLNPIQYLDYFRAISWFTAPGNDAPARGSSFRQTKVSSSIAHLYKRPRTWLEAFHSMGWDANGGVLTRQLDHHLIAGGNLLCMHGLYYSTHGGWWEWAPPCFHFRMPYWPHMKTWLKYAERMSFVLSQGVHVCDIAILYPTETLQAYPEARADRMFRMALGLSNHGLDYDFIDYQSLQNAAVKDGSLEVSDESYKVLILAGTKAMHEETLAKVREFVSNGGIVIKVGAEFTGVEAAAEYSFEDNDALVADIRSRITPDFATSSGNGKVLHRRVADQDVYMIMDVASGDEMTFRAKGKAEAWDAMHGTMSELAVKGSSDGLTTLTYDGPDGNSMLIVFSPGEPLLASSKTGAGSKVGNSEKTVLDGEWDVKVIPTMDNKWGDFRLPASEGFIGVEAREFTFDGMKAVYGYGPYMRTFEVPSDQDIDSVLENLPKAAGWSPYVFSWQYGIFDSPGSQGYHGLKSKVEDKFLILDRGCHQIFAADIDVPSDGRYNLVRRGVKPYRILLDGKRVEEGALELTKGIHSLVAAYPDTKKAEYSLEGMRGTSIDRRDRSMIMVYPEGTPDPAPRGEFESIVASCWYGTPFVPFISKDAGERTFGFETAPGTVTMSFETAGTIEEITVDGSPVHFRETGSGLTPGGHPTKKYAVTKLPRNPGISSVTVKAVPDEGFPGAAFFTEPVKMTCKDGRMEAGDWTLAGAMKFFSGGVRYSKVVRINDKGKKVSLDLGEVDATCEVWVNGKRADILLCPPYRLDISDFVKKGKNRIEVLVYSSLSNHYQTIPSPYQGKPHAGLIGPVTLALDDSE